MRTFKNMKPGDAVEVRSPMRYGSHREYNCYVASIEDGIVALADGSTWTIETEMVARLKSVEFGPAQDDWHIEPVQPKL